MKLDSGLYDEAAPLYTALARASLKSREDADWAHVRDRLGEAASKVEELVMLERMLGWRGEPLDPLLRGFDSLEERGEVMERILRLEEAITGRLTRARLAYNYTVRTRAASYAALLLASLLAVYNSGLPDSLLASLLSLGLSAASLLTIYHRLSFLPALAAVPLLGYAAIVEGYTEPAMLVILLASASALLVAPLPAALRRILSDRGVRNSRRV